MRLHSLLIAALGLVFSVSAAIGVYSFTNGRKEVATSPVLVAAIDVARGTTITADLVKLSERPAGTVPSGSLTRADDALDRSVSIALVAGEPILNAQLSPKGSGRGLAALVPSGMRAVTIQTPNVSTGVAGFVLPGNKVDVLLTIADLGSTSGGTTTNLLQNVEILAVDQRMDALFDSKADTKELRSVTLLVTPRQANLLSLGQNKGTLHLSLRNRDDIADPGIQPVTLNDLRFQQDPAPTPEPAPPPAPRPLRSIPMIRTVRGMNEGWVLLGPSGPAVTAGVVDRGESRPR